MWDTLERIADDVLGLSLRPEDLRCGHMAARAAIVYLLTLVLVRLGGKRFMGRNAAFDIVLVIVLGSVVSRAITGSAPFVPALVAGATLVAVHWAIAWISFRSRVVRDVTEGRPQLMWKDGACVESALRRSQVTRDDLEMAAREAGLPSLDGADRIVLECDGRFSVHRKDPPKEPEARIRAEPTT